jgi:hypothetical protein
MTGPRQQQLTEGGAGLHHLEQLITHQGALFHSNSDVELRLQVKELQITQSAASTHSISSVGCAAL